MIRWWSLNFPFVWPFSNSSAWSENQSFKSYAFIESKDIAIAMSCSKQDMAMSDRDQLGPFEFCLYESQSPKFPDYYLAGGTQAIVRWQSSLETPAFLKLHNDFFCYISPNPRT